MLRARDPSIWSVKGHLRSIHSAEDGRTEILLSRNAVAAMSRKGLTLRCRREKVARQIWWTPIEVLRDVVPLLRDDSTQYCTTD